MAPPSASSTRSTGKGARRLLVGLFLLLLPQASGFFTPRALGAPRHPAPSRARGATRLELSSASTPSSSGPAGDVIRRDGGDAAEGKSQLAAGRPEWLLELMQAKETKLLRQPCELRRLEWMPEDDAAVDELLMEGKLAEAAAYFEEKKATSVPMYRQTLRYHWTQTETELHVGVPVPRAVRGSNLHLIVAEDAFQMALLDDPSFGVISGKFAGQIDPATSGWQLAQKPDGSYSVSMTLRKLSQPGTHSLWYQLFQGEKLATCLQFRGQTDRCRWAQDLDYMNAYFPLPEGVRGKQVQLTIDAGGSAMHLRYPGEEGQEDVEVAGEFCGLVSPDECSWVVDDDEEGRRCICLSLKKRTRDATESSWWSRLFKEEERATPREMQATLDAGVAAARAENERIERELFGGGSAEPAA